MEFKSKKGQSAVEYLMTYGWALLMLVAIIVILLSSGILTPTYLISEECQLGPNFPCRFQLYTQSGDTHLLVRVTNSFPYKVKLTSLNLEIADEGKTFTTGALPNGGEIKSGDEIIVDATVVGYIPTKDSIKQVDAELEYYSCAPEVNPSCTTIDTRTINGRIRGKVIEG